MLKRTVYSQECALVTVGCGSALLLSGAATLDSIARNSVAVSDACVVEGSSATAATLERSVQQQIDCIGQVASPTGLLAPPTGPGR